MGDLLCSFLVFLMHNSSRLHCAMLDRRLKGWSGNASGDGNLLWPDQLAAEPADASCLAA